VCNSEQRRFGFGGILCFSEYGLRFIRVLEAGQNPYVLGAPHKLEKRSPCKAWGCFVNESPFPPALHALQIVRTVYGACNCLAKSRPGAEYKTMHEVWDDTPSATCISCKNESPEQTEDNESIRLCQKYFSIETLRLPVSQNMEPMNHKQPGTRVTSQQQAV
jgi:hypothetical protein